MLPDLNRIKVFYFIFHTQSVGQAARELNISSSAVSQALGKLEEELKLPLFTRLHRKLVPTEAGKQLFKIVSPFIRDLEKGVETILRARDEPWGMLRIGSPIEFGKSYFPGFFASFRKKYPQVVFTMKLGDPSEIFELISQGELDFGLVDIFLTKDQVYGDLGHYSIEPLIDEEVILACSNVYYQREINGDHSFENLARKEFISYQKTSLTIRNWFKHHFNRFSPAFNRVMTVDSHQAVINGILHHLGMGVIARHIVGIHIDAGDIVPVLTGQKDVINKISLVQLQNKVPSLTEKTFIRLLKRDIKESGYSNGFLNKSGP
ncbi:MAG: LysR family transcriptional regulator [Desulfobacter sp.]|nr:LysR family transcriptional regulator [Desulfobacter sp.]WDP87589.1 MAG: LysR family transcriptional regulator [Desulfobacter sp.]